MKKITYPLTDSPLIKKRTFVLLALFITTVGFSQIAENMYHKDYSKLSFVYRAAKMSGFYSGNYDRSTYPNIRFNKSNSSQFGFYYNFAQKGNFNFKTGVIAKEAYPSFDLNVNNADLGMPPGPENSLIDYSPINYFIFSIPMKFEYFIKVNPNINIVLGGGINLDLMTGGDDVTTSISVFNGTEFRDIFVANTEQEQITFSTEISLGLTYNFKFAMAQVDFFYNPNFGPTPATGQYVIYNLENSPTKEGMFDSNGDFYGISIAITPKKGWLRKKAK